ncbi:MAG TPA: PHP domain-containing protein [Anaeromyxobacteraceae bacterium]
MLIDLHVHSHHTQGVRHTPAQAVRRAREAGLDGMVFTDLNTLEGLEEVRAAARAESFLALCGVELATDRGHYLCYFPDPARVPDPPQMFGTTPWPVREVLLKVAELGGVAVAAHPYDKTIERPSGDFVFTLDGLAALEGLNARRKGPANDLAVEAADHMNLPGTGGSGAHDLEEIGRAATLFREVVGDEVGLVTQLRAGAVWCVAIGGPPPADVRGPRPGGDRREGRGPERRGPRRRERR